MIIPLTVGKASIISPETHYFPNIQTFYCVLILPFVRNMPCHACENKSNVKIYARLKIFLAFQMKMLSQRIYY